MVFLGEMNEGETSMRWMMRVAMVVGSLAVVGMVVGMIGCGSGGDKPAEVASADGVSHEGESAEAEADSEDAHGGWWCAEHGVPEEDCSVCSEAAAKRYREKGDWCEEHNRAESQCFQCDPKRAEKFAKLYEAKYGKKPPKPTD